MQAPVAKTTPQWGGCPAGPGDKKPEGAGPKPWRGIGEFQEDWGELQTGKRSPAVFVLDVASGEVAAVQGGPADATCGQPQWSPDGSALVFVAWEQDHTNYPDLARRLGIVFCFNRKCALHAVAWPQPAQRGAAPPAMRIVPEAILSSFSPRFTPDGATLVMVSQQAAVTSGTHNATSTLLSVPWGPIAAALASGSAAGLPAPDTLVDAVWPANTPEEFPGLYAIVLPDQPFVGGGTTLVTTSQWRSNTAVVAVDVESGSVRRLTPSNGASWALVAVHKGETLELSATPYPWQSVIDSKYLFVKLLWRV